ncbi:MAG: amidohydrolase [Acidobacteria bacterium]|nr:amidohydrolase [Acidobacteriota bacterium]
MMKIDVHAHFVPPSVLEQVKQEGPAYGVEIAQWTDEGPQLRLGKMQTRPFVHELHDLAGRQKQLQESEVDQQILSTWLDIVGYMLPAEEGRRWSRMLNRCMSEERRRQGPRRSFHGSATVPLQSGERAAEEIEFAVRECGLQGVIIGTHVNGKNLDDPSLRPFWRAAEKLETPIIIHPFFPLGVERLGAYLFTHIVGLPTETTLAAASLYCGGVVDAFPDLKVVLCHGGGFLPSGWGSRCSPRA